MHIGWIYRMFILRVTFFLSLLLLYGCGLPGRATTPEIGHNFYVDEERRKEAFSLLQNNATRGINKNVVFITMIGEYDDISIYDETAQVLREFYITNKYVLGADYDENYDKRHLSDMKRRGVYGSSVTLDYYLQHRNDAFTSNEIYNLRRLGIKQTPALLILDRNGNTLEFYQGYDVPERSELHDVVCKYTEIRGEGICSEY